MDSFLGQVVYLLNPTSNHNQGGITTATTQLYIFWILHQTTTISPSYLHLSSCISFESYIKPQHRLDHRQPSLVVYLLNPTSNHNPPALIRHCCGVVYLLNPTSNHNYFAHVVVLHTLYIFWILHQTTTSADMLANSMGCISFESYIKPQPSCSDTALLRSCISFESYIKPQLHPPKFSTGGVVYLLNPTSNHNAPHTYS